jgi:hypothetical protein
MAEELDLISNYVDRPGVDDSTKYLLTRLKQVSDAFDNLNAKKIKLSNVTGAKDTFNATKEAQKATEALIKEKQRLLDIDLKAARVASENARALAIEAKARKDNAAAAAIEAREKERAAKGSRKNSNDDYDPNSIPFTHNLKELEAERQLLEKTGDTINDISREQLEAEASANKWAKAQSKVSEELNKGFDDDKFKPVDAYEENIQLLQKNKIALDNNKEAQKNLKKELSDGTISQNQYNKSINGLIKEELDLKKSISLTNAELKNQKREFDSQKGSLEQRRAALIRLNAAYDNLNPQERASAAGQRHLKIISGLTTQVKELEVGTGRAQRNVGNYGNEVEKAAKKTGGLGSALNKATGPLRTLANIIPGLGISGLILALLGPIESFASAISRSVKKVDESRESQKALREVMVEASGEYASSSVKLQSLTDRIKDKNRTDTETISLIRDVNKEYEGFGIHLKNANDLEQFAIKQAPVLLQIFQLKAQAAAAYALATKATEEALKKENQSLDEATDTGDQIFARIKGTFSSFGAFFENLNITGPKTATMVEYYKTLGDIRDKDVKKEEDASQRYIKIGEEAEKKLAEILKKNGLSGGNAKYTALKEIAKKFFDDELKEQADQYKKLSQADEFYQSTRLNYRAKAADLEKEIIEGNRDAEIAAEIIKLREVKAQKEVSANEIINATRVFNQALLDINQKADFKLSQLESDHQSDILQIIASTNQQKKDQLKKDRDETLAGIREASEKKIKAVQDAELKELSASTGRKDADLEKLNNRYQNQITAAGKNQKKLKKITEQYEKERAEIEYNYARYALDLQIQTAEKILAIHKAQGLNVSSEEKAIADLKIQLSDLTTKRVLDNNDREIKSNKEKLEKTVSALQKIKEISDEVFGVIGGLIDASVTADKNRLQEQSDNIDKKKDKEIEAANASALTEEEKANKIAIINARAQSQKEAIEIKQRQLDEKKARFDKAKTIADIILNTSLAVIKALATAKTPADGIAAAIAYGAIGAAQLAVAIATPIPKYKYGTPKEGHPGGDFIAGDGGKREFVIMPSGENFITASTPTKYSAPKGTHVLPDADAFLKNVMAAAYKKLPDAPVTEENYSKVMTEAISKRLDKLNNTIKNKTEVHYSSTHRGLRELYKSSGSSWKYINENINFI